MEELHFIQIMQQLHEIRKENRRIMAQIDDLNAAVASIGTDVSTIAAELISVQNDVATVIEDLKAAEQNGTAPDLSAAIAALQASHSTLNEQAAALTGVGNSIQTALNPPAAAAPASDDSNSTTTTE
jgi:septal ring factor EnvC (AmiA/AmiB activator)